MVDCKKCGAKMIVEEHVTQHNGDYILYECPECYTTCYVENIKRVTWKDEDGQLIEGEDKV